MTTLERILGSGSQAAVRERSFMIVERTATFFWQLLLCIAASCFVAELVGYWMHRLLHSNLIPALSRNHLIHHMVQYAPDGSLRFDSYLDATENRAAIGNVGLEWLVPSGLVLAVSWLVLRLAGVPGIFQSISLITMIVWPLFIFNYLHDRMHLRNFWMARHPLLRNWFVRARRLHDIHHRSLRDDGQMDANFGIGFYLFDRVFCTIARRHRPLNAHGLQAAKGILWEPLAEETPSAEPLSQRGVIAEISGASAEHRAGQGSR
jgi:sterol desaturase/sphingolipid hydroxylase (fatty acid hydroxylase superfamily)